MAIRPFPHGVLAYLIHSAVSHPDMPDCLLDQQQVDYPAASSSFYIIHNLEPRLNSCRAVIKDIFQWTHIENLTRMSDFLGPM
jgi:hypothetical protein